MDQSPSSKPPMEADELNAVYMDGRKLKGVQEIQIDFGIARPLSLDPDGPILFPAIKPITGEVHIKSMTMPWPKEEELVTKITVTVRFTTWTRFWLFTKKLCRYLTGMK